ncbi:MAG: hypothetical protein J0I07_41730 [Myxococcales bacterium]|nr:hypothetical protein [Myxococcales bacterium]
MHRTKRTASLFLIVLLLRGGIACNGGDENLREDVSAYETTGTIARRANATLGLRF